MRHLTAWTLCALAATTPAQTVWNMGAPWTDLAAVVAAAAPGDIVRLNGLSFPPLTMTKGLTMLGPGTIQPPSYSGPVQSTLTIPAGQYAHFVDVDFAPYTLPGILFTTHAVVADGAITFELCRFRQGRFSNLTTSGSVLLHHCQVLGNPTSLYPQPVGGIVVQAGYCALVDCDVHGGDSVFQPAWPYTIASTPALRVNGGTVMAAGTSFFGGVGADVGVFGVSVGASAVVVTAGTCSLADCTVTAGFSPSAAAPPSLAANATTFVARTTLDATNGPASSGPLQQQPELVGLAIDHSLRLGQTSTFTATAGSTAVLGIVASFEGDAHALPPLFDPLIGSPGQIVLLTLALPNAGGTVPRAIVVPNAGTLVGFALYVQALQLVADGVRMSAAVGGVVH